MTFTEAQAEIHKRIAPMLSKRDQGRVMGEIRDVLAQIEPASVTKTQITDEMVERATMVLLGKKVDPSPGINWACDRQWNVNTVRDLMRSALEAALKDKE